ncbi:MULTISPECIES: S26 family signal peptidase [Novosphingobium]|uniref:S26 family signal peptidase n=1 Tax=Novosphingobium mangrovi (ex Huang et al. 2023) TaxID=2976432 RepID=A0ABT2I8L5_9SPHN|nr:MULTISPECIES: S26 family signal peptidase [Novosphingobium]MCT2400887.1 S26 family signal peptidase [Novosphingobium mangrovi (ex Huang et al. 2023)]CCA93230.1 type IV secretory protease [Novosphingobium sp. PP1Y]
MLRLAWNAVRAAWGQVKLLPLRAAVALGSSGLGSPPRPAQLWKAYGIVLPIGFAAAWAIPQVTWVMSPSIDAVAVRTSPGPIRKGDYVMFMLSHPLAGPKPVNVTKQALCMPGERIVMIEKPSMTPGAWDGYYFCNGRLLGVSKPFGRNGQKLVHWQPKQDTIPPGFIFVGSHHPDGFDSRYYGPVAIGRLTRMEKIL